MSLVILALERAFRHGRRNQWQRFGSLLLLDILATGRDDGACGAICAAAAAVAARDDARVGNCLIYHYRGTRRPMMVLYFGRKVVRGRRMTSAVCGRCQIQRVIQDILLLIQQTD